MPSFWDLLPSNLNLSQLMGMPSWWDQAQQQSQRNQQIMAQGGSVRDLVQNPQDTTQDLAGGFGGGILGRIKAYHASPYDFERFDMSKIGTGEGAQAYGHGLYFAEHEPVAQEYKRAFDARSGSEADAKMYQVDINADPEHFLNYDVPIKDQSEAVKKSLSSYLGGAYLDTPNVFPQSLVPSGAVSAKSLRDAGIPGIRYLDQGSRGPSIIYNVGAPTKDFGPYSPFSSRADAEKHLEMLRGQGFGNAEITEQKQPSTSNYVVFDDKLIDIVKKYGLAGLSLLGIGANQLKPPPAQAPIGLDNGT